MKNKTREIIEAITPIGLAIVGSCVIGVTLFSSNSNEVKTNVAGTAAVLFGAAAGLAQMRGSDDNGDQ